MAKSNFSTVSAARIVVETQPDGTTAAEEGGASSLGSATISTLSLGSGNAVSVSAATASTHKVAININGTTYYLLVTNVA
jgi:hypothetical protein